MESINSRNALNTFLLDDTINKISVIKFSTPWCGPCKILTPLLDSFNVTPIPEPTPPYLTDKEKIEYIEYRMAMKTYMPASMGTIDIDQNPELGKIYNITTVPTTLFFFNGTQIFPEQNPDPGATSYSFVAPQETLIGLYPKGAYENIMKNMLRRFY
jgi:thiol-disulfide isomerase/thioredoxin